MWVDLSLESPHLIVLLEDFSTEDFIYQMVHLLVHTFESLDQAADFITGIVRYSYGKGSLFHIFDVGHKLF